MTSITKSELIRQVRIVLDQNEDNGVLSGAFEDTDQLQTDDIIEQCLQYAIDRVLDMAPLWMIPELISRMESDVTARSYGKYGKKCEAPEDMYRPVSMLCTDWEQQVYEFTDKLSPVYAMQKSEFGGIRGNIYDPVVALVTDPIANDGKLYFEIYDTGEQNAYISYVKKLEVDDDMEIPSLILQAIVYTTANLYYVTLGNSNMAEMMAAEAKEALKKYDDKEVNNGK